MKVYVATRFRGSENKKEIEALCKAVDAAKLRSFNFARDVEHYERIFDNQKDVWDRARDEIGACDMFFVDISDNPTGGRMVEAGIAYAMRKQIIIAKKHGLRHKAVFDGIAAQIIEYKDYHDLTEQLRKYDTERSYNMTDKTTLLIMFLMVGAVLVWAASQVFIPLVPITALVYWLVVRHFSATARAFDRIIIYIPLAAVWWAGFALLVQSGTVYGIAWTAGFWLLAFFALRKLKLSL